PLPWTLRPTFRSPDAPSASFTVPALPDLADAGNVQPELRERSALLHHLGTGKARTCLIPIVCRKHLTAARRVRRQLTMQLENDQ
ncbi:hypothetical protein EK21DRAFT_53973, partial [Setomelanomma holmii]